MFQSLEVFQMAHAMAVHAGQKQAVVAENIANVDTPGFVGRDVVAFQAVYANDDATVQRATRARHIHGMIDGAGSAPMIEDRSFASPDGNTVSIEQEMLKAVEARRQHDRAISIYKSALGLLRSSLGRQ